MTASMTAFSHQSTQIPQGNLIWELRSVNHRFLDISLRLPEKFRVLESLIREKIQSKLQRGKIEALLKFDVGENASPQFSLNMGLVKDLAEKTQSIKALFPGAETDLCAILSWPGVLNIKNQEQDESQKSAINLLTKTLEDLQEMRLREGKRIQQFIRERLQKITKIVESLEKQLPELIAEQKKRLETRFAELNLALDQLRLEQEMVLYIQKYDISEELQRLSSHCQAMEHTLSGQEANGRRLDFLTQELHREANTMASKSLAVAVSQAGLELKVIIEQIREQVQNIE